MSCKSCGIVNSRCTCGRPTCPICNPCCNDDCCDNPCGCDCGTVCPPPKPPPPCGEPSPSITLDDLLKLIDSKCDKTECDAIKQLILDECGDASDHQLISNMVEVLDGDLIGKYPSAKLLKSELEALWLCVNDRLKNHGDWINNTVATAIVDLNDNCKIEDGVVAPRARIPVDNGDVIYHQGCTWMSVLDNNTSEPMQGDDTWVCVTKINALYRCCDSVKEQGEETQVWTVPVDGVNPVNYFVDKPYVTTGEFGCRGDCTTDDTEAFNRAVKFAQDNDVILVIQGSIRLTNTITINESIQITGASAPELLTVECSNATQPMYGSWLCYDHMIHGLLFESTDTTVASSVHLSNFGMKRLQQTPANMPYWTPATQIGYDIYFKLFSDGLMRDLVFLNTSLGIKVDKSTRVHLYNTKGQFFARALEVYSADDIKIQGFTSIHYWTKEPAVLEHQRANLTAFVLFGIEHIMFSDIYIKDAYTAISIDVKTSNVNISSLQVSNLVAYGVHTGIYVKQPISDGSFSNVNLRGFDDGSSQKLISIESDNVRLGMLNVVCTQSKNNLLYVSGDNVILAITNFTGVHWDMDLSGDAALYADGVASIMMSGALATYKIAGSTGVISAGDVKTDYAYVLSY